MTASTDDERRAEIENLYKEADSLSRRLARINRQLKGYSPPADGLTARLATPRTWAERSGILRNQARLENDSMFPATREELDRRLAQIDLDSPWPGHRPEAIFLSGHGAVEDFASTVTLGTPPKQKGPGLRCFIAMPFIEHNPDYPFGFFHELETALLTPAITAAGFEAFTARRQGSDIIHYTIVNDLLDADLVVADLTEHNPNVLFELGMRMHADKPIALIRAKGTRQIFDVDGILRVAEYDPHLWTSTVKEDLPILRDHIKGAWDNRDVGQTYMQILQHGAAKREASAEAD